MKTRFKRLSLVVFLISMACAQFARSEDDSSSKGFNLPPAQITNFRLGAAPITTANIGQGLSEGLNAGINSAQAQQRLDIQKQGADRDGEIVNAQIRSARENMVAEKKAELSASDDISKLNKTLDLIENSEFLTKTPTKTTLSDHSGPSVLETKSWLSSKLNGRQFQKPNSSGGTFGFLRMTYGIRGDKTPDCHVRVGSRTYILVAGMDDPIEATSVTDLNFSLIDQRSLKCISGDGSNGGFVLKILPGWGKSFEEYGIDKSTGDQTRTDANQFNINFGGDEQDMCERIGKALSHAADLCGAKQEPF